MDDVTYPIEYNAPEGHVLRKAYVPPDQSNPTPQKPSELYPLQFKGQSFPLQSK